MAVLVLWPELHWTRYYSHCASLSLVRSARGGRVATRAAVHLGPFLVSFNVVTCI